MDETRSDRAGAAPQTADPAGTPPVVRSRAGRSSGRLAVILIVVLGTLADAFAVVYVLRTGVFGSHAPGAELEGRWSGRATVATCEGLICPPSEEIALAIDCSWSSCTVLVFDEPAEIEQAGDRFTASGPIPPWHLEACTGGGFVTGRWSLDLGLEGEALVGRYAEETTSNCGPLLSRSLILTEASWDFELTRR